VEREVHDLLVVGEHEGVALVVVLDHQSGAGPQGCRFREVAHGQDRDRHTASIRSPEG
jgi:hypothetical protein